MQQHSSRSANDDSDTASVWSGNESEREVAMQDPTEEVGSDGFISDEALDEVDDQELNDGEGELEEAYQVNVEEAMTEGSFETEDELAALSELTFNDWGPDPDGAAEAAALAMKLTSQVLWEVRDLPLGPYVLYHFGPNGPPMNIMDVCPITQRLFIANQKLLVGLSIQGLRALADRSCPAAEARCWILQGVELDSQANRVRCGLISGRPVVVAADARGGVTVVPTDTACSQSVLTLRNSELGSNRRTSTWGVGLEPHWSGADEEGTLLVSANDHRVKAWWLEPPETDAPRKAEEDAAHARASQAPKRWHARTPVSSEASASGAASTTVAVPALSSAPPPASIVYELVNNLPCVDLAYGLAIVASLDGSVCAFAPRPPTCEPERRREGDEVDAELADEGTGTGQGAAEGSRGAFHLGSEVAAAEGRPRQPPRFLPSFPAGANFAFAPSLRHFRRTWNALWVPLRSIRTVATPPMQIPSEESVMDWTVAVPGSSDGVTLLGEMVKSFVLPFFEANDLMMNLQLLNSRHAVAARAEVMASHRKEAMALVFAEESAWLVDTTLGMRCQLMLPFSAAFAHVSYMQEASTAFVATKFANAETLWGVTVLRRCRSLRFRLQAQPLMTGNGPDESVLRNDMCIGMATGPDQQLFTLRGDGTLTCYSLALANA
eukprot:TRINITY_DN7307_c0_g3_i1.p1 TRINITY_DN7307_c0_g3~~TRINITY_DN7307_c0_g3_i1.p1  ORF type:complete len:687 (-),score=120.95 TRINITY_DN7307_c0_g3_i1:137-2131(-)